MTGLSAPTADSAPESMARLAGAVAPRLDLPIAMIGLMGAGKSTVGRRLADALRIGFVDADEAIEEAARLSVAEIFERFGEAHFRDGERRVIARLIEERRGVIATGGGAFMDDATRGLLLERAICVWVDCDIATLVERTGRKDTRPLLKDGDPEAILTRLHRERSPIYAEAHLRVPSDDGPHSVTVARVLEAIDAWLK